MVGRIVKREFRAHFRGLMIWCAAQILLIVVGMVKYEGFQSSGVDVGQLFEAYPKGLLTVMGISDVDISTVAGFYTVFFLYFMLLGAIHAGMLGAVMISKDERDHNADFLFSKPISRRQILTGKLVSAVLHVVVFNGVTGLTSVLCIRAFNGGDPMVPEVTRLMAALLVFQGIFLAVGLAFGAMSGSAKRATGMVTAVILGSFFLSIVSDLHASMAFLGQVTPFKVFSAKEIVFEGSFPWLRAGIWLTLCAVWVAVMYRRFQNRDIKV